MAKGRPQLLPRSGGILGRYTADVIIPFGFAQATFFMEGSGAPTGAAVTMGLDPATGLSPATVAASLELIWDTRISPIQIQNVDVTNIRVKFGPNTSGPSVDRPVTLGGNLVTAQAPPNVALLVQKATGLGGKKGRGRLYLPGIPEVEIDQGGNISGSYFASCQTAWNGFYNDLVAADIPMVLLHTGSSDPTAVTELVVSALAATQRRRLRR